MYTVHRDVYDICCKHSASFTSSNVHRVSKAL